MTPDVWYFNMCVFMFEENMSCDLCLAAFCCHVFNGSSPGLYLCIMGFGTSTRDANIAQALDEHSTNDNV